MRRNMKHTMILLSAALLLPTGCVDETSPEGGTGETFENATAEQALEAITDELGIADDGSLGRLDDSDESPAFGNADFAREFDGRGDADVRGDMVDDREMDDDLARPDGRLFHVMAVWGRIRPNDETRPEALRWNPTISVAEGDAVRVLRTLRFERGDEVLGQDARNQVQITSATMPHVDGVILQVLITSDDSADAFLRFRSAPLSVEIPARSLPDLDEVHLIDRAGNGLTLVAIERPIVASCASGFMSGRWVHNRDNGGVFGGSWHATNGRRTGHLVGRYGVNDAGEQVFHGKVVNAAGEFLALMSGNWGEGSYRGLIFGRGGNVVGSMHGHYAAGDERGHGQFRGQWQQNCATDAPDDSCRLSTDGRPDDCTTDRPDDGSTDRPDDGSTDRPDDGSTDERPADDSRG